MLLNQLRCFQPLVNVHFGLNQTKFFGLCSVRMQTLKAQEIPSKLGHSDIGTSANETIGEMMFTAPRVMPMVLTKEPVVLSFDDMPGPKTLKYLSSARHYLSQIGTQLTAGALTLGLNISSLISRKSLTGISALFEEYGPVVRFVSPLGSDIVLINHPDHIQKVFSMEGEFPVRSTLDSLEKYRKEHRNHLYGIYSVNGQEWIRQRSLVSSPLDCAVTQHLMSINDICEGFTQKLYNLRNHQDEVPKDLYKELHKWAFDCMGLIIFSKKFSMLDTELVYSQCDMSWLYHSLEKATEAIVKCESGLRLWKLFPTPAWYSLVKNCDSLDKFIFFSLIGKHVLEAEQAITLTNKDGETFNKGMDSLIASMLVGENRLSTEDISTILMDMLLIGVNTISTSSSFLLFYLAKYQRSQKLLLKEIDSLAADISINNVKKLKESTPYLQACIKETLRLVPPIPLLTRVLPKNITLDKYNIPRGTLIMMSTQDAAQKERNFDDADKFLPERWLKSESQEYHAFASIPFGFGARKCLGQNIAETMMTMLAIQLLQKFKLEYHYADIAPTKEFIAKPNKPLKIRFVDRI
ncbi:probable cytochrome P450 301a1, mitochondrial isoform X3 [Choristoneura fumiferana]|uniref:probable cytochrome P450 301a1, mitochondrial isoform X3 n=1 Tax=Choristoneura fumiferana TaxID=7141 RepID=UPI003D156F09